MLNAEDNSAFSNPQSPLRNLQPAFSSQSVFFLNAASTCFLMSL